MDLTWGAEADDGVLLVSGPAVVDLLGRPDHGARDDPAHQVALVPSGALAVPGAVVPTAGRWSTDGHVLRFTPSFPFRAGTTYTLLRRDAAAEGPGATRWVAVAHLERPAAKTGPSAEVRAVHPSGPEVPENLLRLSVTFSVPMDEGSAAGHVHLEDGDGHDIPHALLAMPPELWDRPRRRLTLLLEPGRIKRGLAPHAALGTPLSRSRVVTLVVDATLRGASGSALVAGARHTYRVGPAVRARVDPQRWRVAWPSAGSRDSLVVDFERPLDHALVLRCLRVATADGDPVPGHAVVGRGETRWSFTATTPWPPGVCELHVDPTLEDLAGNSVRRVFDRDLRLEQDDPLDVAEVVLSSGRGVG